MTKKLIDWTREIAGKLHGDKEEMLAQLLAANLSGKKLVLIEQRFFDNTVIKYQYKFIDDDLCEEDEF